MVTVTVCVGSSCHIKGAREMIMRFNDLLKEHQCVDGVELQGSFCMERCGEGINWQINADHITSPDVQTAIQTFLEQVIQPLKGPAGI